MRARFIALFVGLSTLTVVTACGGPATAAAPPTGGVPPTSQPQAFNVNMTDANQFQPATLSVPAGATVTWTNAGAVQHTVTDDPSKAVNAADASLPAGAAALASGPVNGGQTFSHTFITPGTYKYFCIPHESLGMRATITVT